jgi:hypothetical protein
VDTRTTAEVHAANGFELADDDVTSLGGGSGYLAATLT